MKGAWVMRWRYPSIMPFMRPMITQSHSHSVMMFVGLWMDFAITLFASFMLSVGH